MYKYDRNGSISLIKTLKYLKIFNPNFILQYLRKSQMPQT